MRQRDRIDNPGADARQTEDQKQDTGDENRAERHLPAVVQPFYDAIGEIGVHPHARRERQRIIREERHQHSREGGGETGRDKDGAAIHPRAAQDQRVDEHDVGHRQIGRQAGEDFDPNRRAVLVKPEQFFEHVSPSPVCRRRRAAPATPCP